MAKVNFTYALKRFFPGLAPLELDSPNVRELLSELDRTHPGIRAYLVNDQGALRQHVNVFVDNELISDREQLSDLLDTQSEVYIMQALSGG